MTSTTRIVDDGRSSLRREAGSGPDSRRSLARALLGCPLVFLAPAIFFLAVWMVYPTIATIVRSLYGDRGDEFVWFENYERMFTDDVIFTAIKNNALWVLIVPATVTAVGLVFAVLTERVWWAIAFKIAVFMPLAVSLFAVGVIWRIMYERRIPTTARSTRRSSASQDVVADAGVLPTARPSTEELDGLDRAGLRAREAGRAG